MGSQGEAASATPEAEEALQSGGRARSRSRSPHPGAAASDGGLADSVFSRMAESLESSTLEQWKD